MPYKIFVPRRTLEVLLMQLPLFIAGCISTRGSVISSACSWNIYQTFRWPLQSEIADSSQIKRISFHRDSPFGERKFLTWGLIFLQWSSWNFDAGLVWPSATGAVNYMLGIRMRIKSASPLSLQLWQMICNPLTNSVQLPSTCTLIAETNYTQIRYGQPSDASAVFASLCRDDILTEDSTSSNSVNIATSMSDICCINTALHYDHINSKKFSIESTCSDWSSVQCYCITLNGTEKRPKSLAAFFPPFKKNGFQRSYFN